MRSEKTYSENRFHIQRFWAELRNLTIDLQYGGSLLGTVRSSKRGHTYVSNSDYSIIEWLAESIDNDVEAGDLIVDVGCGKGRAISGFHYYFNRRRQRSVELIGIEYEQEVAAITQQRFADIPGIEIISGDATAFLPPNAKFIFMANPFSDPGILEAFIANFIRIHKDAERPAKLLYYCPRMIDQFRQHGQLDLHVITQPNLVRWKINDLYRTAAIISLRK